MKLKLLHPLRWLRAISGSRLPGFDPVYYLYWYKDVDEAGFDPQRHYLESGWKEGRDPSAGFSTLGYLAANLDVAAAGINPLLHFVMIGLSEGRVGHAKDPKSVAPQPGSQLQSEILASRLPMIPSLYGSRPLQGFLDGANFGWVWGWALSAYSPNTPPEIEIWIEHCLVGTVLANKFRADMASSDYDHGCHGFEFEFKPPLAKYGNHVVTVRRAVDKLCIGQITVFAASENEF